MLQTADESGAEAMLSSTLLLWSYWNSPIGKCPDLCLRKVKISTNYLIYYQYHTGQWKSIYSSSKHYVLLAVMSGMNKVTV